MRRDFKMTEKLRFNVYVKIKKGRHEDFKKIAKDWSAYQLKGRLDILSYEWFFLEKDQSQALIMEVYENSDAMMATYKALDESDEHFEETDYPYEIIKTEVCGKVSEELKNRIGIGKSRVEHYTHLAGFTR